MTTYEVVGLEEAVDDTLPGLPGSSDDEHEWLGTVGHCLRCNRMRILMRRQVWNLYAVHTQLRS